jgi:hypothetical protein
LNVDSVPPSQGRPTGGCTDTSGWGGFSFSFHRKVLCLDAGAGCGAAGPTEGWASLADGVALVTPVMRSAVLKNPRTVLVWPLASRWRPACQFAAATNRLTHGASSLPSSTQPPPATGSRFPTIAPPASARQAPHPPTPSESSAVRNRPGLPGRELFGCLHETDCFICPVAPLGARSGLKQIRRSIATGRAHNDQKVRDHY